MAQASLLCALPYVSILSHLELLLHLKIYTCNVCQYIVLEVRRNL